MVLPSIVIIIIIGRHHLVSGISVLQKIQVQRGGGNNRRPLLRSQATLARGLGVRGQLPMYRINCDALLSEIRSITYNLCRC